ncbi:MAG: hypothetical protein WB681_09170 [Candidatus Cybelea sp.]
MPLRLARFATLASVAVLAACSSAPSAYAPASSQPAPHVIRFGGQVVRFGDASQGIAPGRGWISPTAKKRSLLYASSYDGGYINIYPEGGNNQQPIGKLTSGLVSPQGLIVDRRDRLWVANTNAFNVVAFKRGATAPFTTLSDPNYFPISVAVDGHGTVYAANAEATTGPPGNVTVWAKGHTSPTGTLTYSNFNIVIGVGVDAQNNVYVSYIPTSGPPAMVKFPAGSQTGQPVAIQDANLGDLTFDASQNLVMETLSNTLGVWAPPYTSGPTRTIPAFGNEPTLDKREHKVWIAYANFSTPMVEGYNYSTGAQVDVITNGWTTSAVPYGVALDPALAR